MFVAMETDCDLRQKYADLGFQTFLYDNESLGLILTLLS
jgi:hypothetical protein